MHLRTGQILSVVVVLAVPSAAQDVVKYHSTMSDVKYVYGVTPPRWPG